MTSSTTGLDEPETQGLLKGVSRTYRGTQSRWVLWARYGIKALSSDPLKQIEAILSKPVWSMICEMWAYHTMAEDLPASVLGGTKMETVQSLWTKSGKHIKITVTAKKVANDRVHTAFGIYYGRDNELMKPVRIVFVSGDGSLPDQARFEELVIWARTLRDILDERILVEMMEPLDLTVPTGDSQLDEERTERMLTMVMAQQAAIDAKELRKKERYKSTRNILQRLVELAVAVIGLVYVFATGLDVLAGALDSLLNNVERVAGWFGYTLG